MRIQLIFIVLFSLAAHGVQIGTCADYLKEHPEHGNIGITRLESFGGTVHQVYDVSDYVVERRLPTDKAINIFRPDSLFAEGKLFLGFGRPNVYLAFPPNEERKTWEKFDAKSLKRADSKVVDTRGFAQSGILLVFKDLSPDQVESIYQMAKNHEGSRNWTCVNSNCRVLSDAGFSIPGQDLKEIYFPTPLLKSLLNKGLNLNGEPVDFDLVRVNPEFLETLRARIDKAVALTLCRHADRSCEEDKKSIANHTLLAFPKKMGRRMLSLFLAENPTRPVVKETPVRLRNEEPTNKYTYDISVSEPSQFGTLLRVLWGPHAKFKVDLSGFDLDKRFGPNRLKAYPTRPKKIKDQVLQSLKKNIAFNRMMVGFISHHLQRSEKNFEGVSMSQLYDMLRVQTEDSNNKYTFVLTSKDVTITKIDIQNSKVDWVLTKHLIASNYSDDVIFAGEFYKAADGSIHIDDNSGTYQPPKGLVYKVADLFREIFPGVTIVVHGHE